MDFVALKRERTHRAKGKDGWYNDYPPPCRWRLNRPENVRPTSPKNSDFHRRFRRRNDAESINRGLDDTLFLRRPHSHGLGRQWIQS